MPESSAAKTSRMKWGAAATPTQHANRGTVTCLGRREGSWCKPPGGDRAEKGNVKVEELSAAPGTGKPHR